MPFPFSSSHPPISIPIPVGGVSLCSNDSILVSSRPCPWMLSVAIRGLALHPPHHLIAYFSSFPIDIRNSSEILIFRQGRAFLNLW